MGFVGYALLILLAVLLLVLFVPVFAVVCVKTGQPAHAYIRWLIFKFHLLPYAKKEEEKSESTETEERKKKPKKPKKEKVKAKPTEAADTIGVVVDLLSSAKGGLRFLLRHFRFYKIKIHLMVAEDDAAQTAIAYGKINVGVYAAYAVAASFLNLAKPDLAIYPNFTAREGSIDLEFRARLTIAVVLGVALQIGCAFLWKTIRRKKQEEKSSVSKAKTDDGCISPK